MHKCTHIVLSENHFVYRFQYAIKVKDNLNANIAYGLSQTRIWDYVEGKLMWLNL